APAKHRRTDPDVLERLRIYRDASIDEQLLAVIDEAGLKTIELLELSARRGLVPARVRERLMRLGMDGRVRLLTENPSVMVAAKAFNEAARAAADLVGRFHETNPLVPGIGREELKARLFSDAPNLLFQAVLDKLVADNKIVLAQDLIHAFGRR